MQEAHDLIRLAILRGELLPGQRLSQAKLAQSVGISRTPLREALRMIQREGLITTEPGRMIHIASVTVGDLDELYALRINLETASARMAVPNLVGEDLSEMERCFQRMIEAEEIDDFDIFDEANRAFHHVVLKHAGSRTAALTDELSEHSTRYRRLYLSRPVSWHAGRTDHEAILKACRDRDGAAVAVVLAHHYARASLAVAGLIDPSYEPKLIRAAIRDALRGSGDRVSEAAGSNAGGKGSIT